MFAVVGDLANAYNTIEWTDENRRYIHFMPYYYWTIKCGSR